MSEKYSIRAEVISQEQIASGIYSLVLSAPQIAESARPGQFVSLYCEDRSHLLPRPVSLCGIDAAAGTVRLIYRVAGAGTLSFSGLKGGDGIDVTGPLGNGFPLEKAAGKKAVIFGGGIGIPPMLALARQIKGEKAVVLGYRDELFLADAFAEAAGEVVRPDAIAEAAGEATRKKYRVMASYNLL